MLRDARDDGDSADVDDGESVLFTVADEDFVMLEDAVPLTVGNILPRPSAPEVAVANTNGVGDPFTL